MGIPPGVPLKAAKSIGPCPSYCRADCPGTQRPAHPPGACPSVPAAWLQAAALRLIRKVLFNLRRTCSGQRMTQMGASPAEPDELKADGSAPKADFGLAPLNLITLPR